MSDEIRHGKACEECRCVGNGFSADELGIDTTTGHPAVDYRVFLTDDDTEEFATCTFCQWPADVVPVTYSRYQNDTEQDK